MRRQGHKINNDRQALCMMSGISKMTRLRQTTDISVQSKNCLILVQMGLFFPGWRWWSGAGEISAGEGDGPGVRGEGGEAMARMDHLWPDGNPRAPKIWAALLWLTTQSQLMHTLVFVRVSFQSLYGSNYSLLGGNINLCVWSHHHVPSVCSIFAPLNLVPESIFLNWAGWDFETYNFGSTTASKVFQARNSGTVMRINGWCLGMVYINPS